MLNYARFKLINFEELAENLGDRIFVKLRGSKGGEAKQEKALLQQSGLGDMISGLSSLFDALGGAEGIQKLAVGMVQKKEAEKREPTSEELYAQLR